MATFANPSGLLADTPAGDNAPPFTVSELSGALKRTVESAFGHVRVRGEISGFKRHASGHCYLTLKDDRACMDGVIWKGCAGMLRFRPEDGIEVVATGKLTTFPGRSKYQLVIDTLELAGQGALMALLDKRRQALAAEGLFDVGRKQPLPFLPARIGVVTSPTGAVIRDILHRLADRCPTHVLVWPVAVQGEAAAGQIAAAVTGFNAMSAATRPDLVIVARGGGSIEDLWAFNEEIVVRAIAGSAIPTISAVGHETDTTLADHAADIRASTPTAAAEIAVPVRAELLAQIRDLSTRTERCVQRAHERAGEQLQASARRLPEPAGLLGPQRQRLDDVGDRLPRALRSEVAHARSDLNRASGGLRPVLLEGLVRGRRERLAGVRMPADAMRRRFAEMSARINALWRLAELAHPEKPLSRGFARVTALDGTTLASAAAAGREARLRLIFHDGDVAATTSASEPPARVERSRRRGYSASDDQPGLL